MQISTAGKVKVLRQSAILFALLSAWVLAAAPAQAQTLVSIAVTPASASVASGMTQQFTATGTYSDSSTQNLTSSVTWSSTSTAVASINNVGLVTGLAVGSTTIEAVSGSISGSAALTVTASGLVGYWTFNDGSGTTAVDSSGNGNTATLVNGVSWVTGKIGDAVSANGVNQYASIPTINLSGTSAVTWAAWVNRTYSTSGGHTLFEDSTNFNNSTTGFGFFPDDPSCGGIATGVNGNVGYTLNCYNQPSSGAWHHLAVVYDKTKPGSSVISLYIDGVLQTPTRQPDTSTNTNAFGNNPLYLFSRGGTQEYTAGEVDDLRLYNQALSASQIQQIYQQGTPSLVSIAVTPANASIAKGTTQQYTATGTYSDSSTQNLTSSATWTSTSTATATINSSGLATAVATGNTAIQATSGSITGSTGLTVTPAVLVSIAVTPANPLIASGTTQQFTATGTYSDSSTQNLTSSVTWSSTNTAAATISSAGLATGVATGSTTIQATLGSIKGSTGLTVTATLVSITVTPANPSIAAGATQQFTATGTYSDSTTQNVTSLAAWTSTNTAVATINASGLATAVSTGSTTIQATYGGFTGSTGLTVTTAVLVSIAVTPANASIATGGTQQFTATGTYSDNSTQNLTGSVTWSSTNTAVATITGAGLATAAALGTTTIQAASGSITGTTTLTVTSTIPGLVGWWKFDDGSGTTAVDSSGNGNTATLVNGVSWVTGETGGAVSANGVNQYVNTPSINLSSTNAVTVALWVNRTYSTVGGHTLFEDSTNFNNSTTGFGLFPDESACNGIMVGLNGNVGYTINCYTQPTSGAWHHLAAVYDKSQSGSNEVSFYIDGVLQTPTKNDLAANNTNDFGPNPIYLFARGGTTGFNAGTVDDLRLYSQALTAAQIQQIYKSGLSEAALTITMNPASVVAGGVSTGTVTLQNTAPTGGAVVTLSSSNPLVASVPANVTVPAGSTTATFTVNTNNVSNPTTLVISGTYVATNTTNLTVTPALGQFVQGAGCDSGAASSSSCGQNGNSTTGNLILVFNHWDNQTITVSSISDNLGNTYVPIGGPVNSGPTARFQAWYAKNIKGGSPLEVTATYSGKTTSFSLVDVFEYSGLDTSAPLDVFASAAGSGMAQNSGPSPTTTASNETILGLFGYSSFASPYTAGADYTFVGYEASSMLEDRSVTATGSYAATASSSVSTNWAAFVIGFKNASQPGAMSQVASDSFSRANASTLGLNWTPLVGVSTNVALQIVNNQVEATAVSPSVAKEMYYGGLNWTPDQYSQVQIVAASGTGYEGPAVRMTSNDTHYACVVYSLGSGSASVGIVRDVAGTYLTLANSITATVTAGDTVQCIAQETSLTMIDQTTSTVLLTASDDVIPSGYPGLVDSAGSGSVTNYVMANWTAGASAALLSVQQLASDNFNRANALNLGPNWDIGTGHGPIQIVSDQIQPYPAGGTPPSKEHYVAAGPFPNDQWSQLQVVFEDEVGDVAAEVRASDTADNMYVCDVNVTGPAGAAETRLDMVMNGTINTLVTDQKWSQVSPGDYIRGQAQGNLISLIDVTTGQLLLTAFDTTWTSGYPGISMQALTGNPPDHIAANWSGGGF
ncbi:MAG TPA: Ig-like domain-containing protein [Terriglobales bacterium]